MIELLIGLVPYYYNNIVVVTDTDNSTTCVVVEKAEDPRFGSDRFGEVDKPVKEIRCD